MSQLVTGKKSRKKQSAFEKLWARAAKLRSKNARFTTELDAIVERMESTIRPRETELARSQLPLLQKLLKLGQRKSMTNWERETLDDWIRELVTTTQIYGLITEELMDDVARYDAFRNGITLEDSSIPPHQQFADIVKQAEEDRAEEIERQKENQQQAHEQLREMLLDEAKLTVARKLDSAFGPENVQSEDTLVTQDLFADELEVEVSERRAELYEILMAEELAKIEAMLNVDFNVNNDDAFEFNDFDFSGFDDDAGGGNSTTGESQFDKFGSDLGASTNQTALENDTFQRLFRATAGRLHPDREPDSEVRKEKQKLMANLLKARKEGDVMTVLEMYESYVGAHDGFSKKDQKSLTESLRKMIAELESQSEEIAFQSPVHAVAYQFFYHSNRKKIDAAFAERLREIKSHERIVAQLITTITSLKSLKPELEVRYEAMMFSSSSLDDLMDSMGGGRSFF